MPPRFVPAALSNRKYSRTLDEELLLVEDNFSEARIMMIEFLAGTAVKLALFLHQCDLERNRTCCAIGVHEERRYFTGATQYDQCLAKTTLASFALAVVSTI